jgi:hypothetical protein
MTETHFTATRSSELRKLYCILGASENFSAELSLALTPLLRDFALFPSLAHTHSAVSVVKI